MATATDATFRPTIKGEQEGNGAGTRPPKPSPVKLAFEKKMASLNAEIEGVRARLVINFAYAGRAFDEGWEWRC